jgi:hypothetical protein
MFSLYPRLMEWRQDPLAGVVIELITESLLASPRFRRRGRDWAARREEDERIARLCAVAIIEHLRRCGIEWTQRPPLPPHRAGE